MLQSMTGYGKLLCETKSRSYSIEIRSINSKYTDINLRIPLMFRNRETILRSVLSNRLIRGKIEMSINIESWNGDLPSQINRDLFEQYFNELHEIAKQINLPVSGDWMPAILRMPEVMSQPQDDIDEEEWAMLLKSTEATIDLVEETRIREGRNLQDDLVKRIGFIRNQIGNMAPLEEERIAKTRSNLKEALTRLNGEIDYDPNRLEQEMIYYLEKFDITEEKVRLDSHCRYFSEVMEKERSNGKKLNFIAQEIGREVNTIGSKANHATLQYMVVEMKDELEKIKEQLANIL